MGEIRTNTVVALLRLTQDTRYNLLFHFSVARPIDHNRNKIAQNFLETDCDYLLMIDSDVVPEGNSLDLISLDLDVVTLLYPIWKHRGARVIWCVIDKPGGEKRETDLGTIAEINTCGAGALLIARRVLEHSMLKVPFKTQYDEHGIVKRSEDFAFCDKTWAAGFQVWAALDYKCSHEKTVDLRVVGECSPHPPWCKEKWPMAKEWIAVYLGTGFVPGIPARDLTQAEVKRFGVSNLKKSGIYTLMEAMRQNMGTKVLTKVQAGVETTHGTAVAADTMLLMQASLPESDREVHIPQVDMGVRSPGLLAAAQVRHVLAEGTLEDMDGAYFEILPLMFSMGLKGNVTATEATTGQSDYLWEFPAPQTGVETVDSVTLEMGDDTQGYEVAYCLMKTLRISGDCETGEVHISGDWFGDEVIQTTVTPAQAAPTAEMMNAKLARLYVDATWADLGSAELEKALVNFDIVINTGIHPKFFGSAVRTFDSHGQGEISAEATFTLERIAAVATEELKFRPASGYAQTARFVQLKIAGNQIGTGTYQTLKIDLAGLWTAWKAIGTERNGNTLDVVTLKTGYDATGAQAVNVEVTTTISTI